MIQHRYFFYLHYWLQILVKMLESLEVEYFVKLAKVPYVCHLKKNYIDRRGIRCMVMEYAEGGNMLEWLRMVRNFN